MSYDREQFEKVAREIYKVPTDVKFERWPDGNYVGSLMSKGWMIWQAAYDAGRSSPPAKPPEQLDRLRDFINMVREWTATFPLKGAPSNEDLNVATELYCCCEGAEENLYELRQMFQSSSSVTREEPNPFEPEETRAEQDRRVGQMIRDNANKRMALPHALQEKPL